MSKRSLEKTKPDQVDEIATPPIKRKRIESQPNQNNTTTALPTLDKGQQVTSRTTRLRLHLLRILILLI